MIYMTTEKSLGYGIVSFCNKYFDLSSKNGRANMCSEDVTSNFHIIYTLQCCGCRCCCMCFFYEIITMLINAHHVQLYYGQYLQKNLQDFSYHACNDISDFCRTCGIHCQIFQDHLSIQRHNHCLSHPSLLRKQQIPAIYNAFHNCFHNQLQRVLHKLQRIHHILLVRSSLYRHLNLKGILVIS